jgi:hypothetical protein
MALQDFATLAAGDPSLMRRLELIILDGHRRLYAAEGKPWSEAIAYHWLHYEDPMPVARLADGVRSLMRARINLDPEAVDKVCAEAHKLGFLN